MLRIIFALLNTLAFDPSEQRENDGSFVQGLAAGLGLALVAVAGIVATLILRQRFVLFIL